MTNPAAMTAGCQEERGGRIAASSLSGQGRGSGTPVQQRVLEVVSWRKRPLASQLR